MQQSIVLSELFRSIDRKDINAFGRVLADDCVFRFGNAEPITGRAGVLQAVDGFLHSVKTLHHNVAQTWVVDYTMICHGIVTYTRFDDSILTVPFANIFMLNNGLITRYLIFADISALALPASA